MKAQNAKSFEPGQLVTIAGHSGVYIVMETFDIPRLARVRRREMFRIFGLISMDEMTPFEERQFDTPFPPECDLK